MAAAPDAFEPATDGSARLDPAATSALEAAVDAARSALETAPVPGWVMTATGLHANRAAARWAQAFDRALPGEAGPLPPGHVLANAVRRAALQALAEGGSASLALGPLAQHARITAHTLGGRGALTDDPAWQTPVQPLVAWLQPATAAAGEDPQTLAERLSLAVESAHVGLWELDIASGQATWNAQQYALMRAPTGAPPPTFEAWLARVHPDDRAGMLARWQAFLASGERYETSYRLLHADGTVNHLRAQALAIKDVQGRVIRAVGSNRDVTAEWRGVQERDELLKRLQLATHIAHIGVWETHLADHHELLDDATCRMLGFGPGPQRRPSADFVACLHPEDRARVLDEHAQILAGRRPESTALAFRILRDGEERHLLSHVAVERAADGHPQRVLGTVFDVTELRRAERLARTAAERMEIATRLGGLSVFERDAQDRFIHFDGMLAALYGVQPGQPAPPFTESLERVLPEDRERFEAARARRRAADDPVRCEYRARAADGSVRDLLSWRRRRTDAQGAYLGEIGALMDVTEQRSAERRAREYGAWLAIATGSAGMGVWEIDVEAGQVIGDERAHRLLENQLWPPPASFEQFAALIEPADLGRVQEAIACTVVENGKQVDTEFRVRLPGGVRTMNARGEAHRDADGKVLRIMGVIWDVTERRAAEARARETADRLQLAALGAGIGSWERSFDGERGAWDAQMYKLFGATPADGDPHTVSLRCVLPEDWPTIDRARREALRAGEFAATYRIRRGDGEIRWLSGRGRTRFAADGAPLSIVGVTWDITEARAADAALRAKETAEQASRAKSEFLSRMSHELRTPLNAIVGFTQLLELDQGDPLSITQRERVGLIRSSGWHLLNLINDVLDLARIESGRSTVAMEVVAWGPVLDEAVAMVQPEASARGIVLETRSESDVPDTVWADPVRLRQVLLNLLSNAVKYNRDRGSVQVGVRVDGNSVSFAVRDTGRGMSPGQLSRLFQPFNRLGIDSLVPAGTGIGLAISQRLMQQMEGAIEVDSTLGVGSEFRVRVRAARMEKPQAVVPQAAGAAPLSMREDIAGTLIYIEDNPANAALVEQFLHFRPRIKLYQAADGATGLVMAAVCQPDLALIDIRLPDMMGDEVLRQLRQQPETRDVPSVAVSANAMPHDIEAALAAGFVEYWTKPLDVTHFLRGIDRLLARTDAPLSGGTP
jgi:signal transduction histidine kinase/CheY-like chemotaxis protein